MSTRRLVLGLVAALVFGVTFAVLAGGAGPAPRLSVGLSGTLTPLPDGSYLFDAQITDLQRNEPIASPQIRFASGQTSTLAVEDGEHSTLKLMVSANKDESTATVELSQESDSARVTLSRVQLRLR